MADRGVILCVILYIWKQFLGTGRWVLRFLEDRSACVVFAAASLSTACVSACNKISYKNSASLISGRVSSCDVTRMLIDFQKDNNIVKRKNNNWIHNSFLGETGNFNLRQKDLHKVRVNWREKLNQLSPFLSYFSYAFKYCHPLCPPLMFHLKTQTYQKNFHKPFLLNFFFKWFL